MFLLNQYVLGSFVMQQKLTDTSVFWAGWIQLYSALSGMEFLQDRKCFFVYLVSIAQQRACLGTGA